LDVAAVFAAMTSSATLVERRSYFIGLQFIFDDIGQSGLLVL